MKRVFRYLWGNSKYSLCFHGYLIIPWNSVSIHGYVDSNRAGDIDSRRSTNDRVHNVLWCYQLDE